MAEFYYAEVGKNEDIVSVVLSGQLDALGSEYLLKCVEKQIQRGCQKLILDCDRLDYISSMGMGTLIRVHSRMKKVGGDVKLAAVHGAVAKLIQLVRLDKALQVYPTVKDAIAAHDEEQSGAQ